MVPRSQLPDVPLQVMLPIATGAANLGYNDTCNATGYILRSVKS